MALIVNTVHKIVRLGEDYGINSKYSSSNCKTWLAKIMALIVNTVHKIVRLGEDYGINSKYSSSNCKTWRRLWH
jgi:hypothetical protein